MFGKTGRSLVLFTSLALATLNGCRSTPVQQAAPLASRLTADASQANLLEAGRAIYTGQCNRCHRPKRVQDYTAAEWSGRILPKMAKKAKLEPPQTEAVLAYILAARAAAPAGVSE